MMTTAFDTGHSVEMLSIEQFAAKMGVGRTTVYQWFKSGYLRPGRHYIKIGKTTLFAWGAELLQKLHEDSVEAAVPEKEQSVANLRPVVKASKNKGIQINLDY